MTNDNERIDSLGEHYVDCHISSLLNDLVDAINSATIKNDVFKFIKSNINKLKTNFNNYKSKATQPKPAGEQRNVFTHYQKIYDFAKCLKHIRLNTSKENRLSENDIK
ncbi:MAG: hypothetical protein MJ233_05320 [Mycoplasmoidaceae bacterium]|nr:hypothetical protein [Mycoplasmoidaceae bacterium]